MYLKKIKTLTYNYGEEKELQDILFKATEPLLIHIKGFPNTFTLDYFIEKYHGVANYSVFDNYRYVGEKSGDLKETFEEIKNNKPFRIFGLFFTRENSSIIEKYVPLWQTIPFNPRFYNPMLKVAYFFGGRGSATEIHFDREHCCNLHLCMSGKKQVLLFTEDENDSIYKVPYIGNSLIDFGQPLDQLHKKFPRLKKATGYNVILNPGDMIFMPRNCWHYTRYLEGSTSATYVFYTSKFWQFYGYFTGYFFLGYERHTATLKISEWSLFKKFSLIYAMSDGWKKFGLKAVENISYIFLLPLISIGAIATHKIRLFRKFIKH
ncbi:cupin [Legionella qingyii]|uniref:Cupin n=1 Tax=Legionella qingyii TaxID=2184757 RepID=A0A317U0R7_9GAMM|nr:cupin-like domain-containing protein [Legionella qingyii]PWY53960.1 cupin [Legionella qingyii]RUR18924.1 cupin [Legionella qingyii]RUR21894.1 cupin [Legionella qingyii]